MNAHLVAREEAVVSIGRTALVLGGTTPHIALIRNLKARGFYTILVDYLPDPPAKAFADDHVQASTLDPDAVLEIARARQATLVISTCIDHANRTACYVAEELGLPAPYSDSTARRVTNKISMKQGMVDAEVPTSRYIEITGDDLRATNGMVYPLIVKPVDGNSSRGVRRVDEPGQLEHFVHEARRASRSQRVIVEEYVDGSEVGIYSFVHQGVASVILAHERRKIPQVLGDEQQIYGSTWSQSLYADQYRRFGEISTAIARAFGVERGPLMIQAIVTGEGLQVIEFAPRLGGGESHRIIELCTGFDILDATVESFLGTQVKPNIGDSADCFADTYLYPRAGIFGRLAGYEPLITAGTIEYVEAYKTPGTRLDGALSSNNRAGVFTVRGRTRQDLATKTETALSSIQVLDTDGQTLLREALYERQAAAGLRAVGAPRT